MTGTHSEGSTILCPSQGFQRQFLCLGTYLSSYPFKTPIISFGFPYPLFLRLPRTKLEFPQQPALPGNHKRWDSTEANFSDATRGQSQRPASFQFLYIGPGARGNTYVFVMKDSLSSSVMLVAAKTANEITTANALIQWFSTFDVILEWVSDRGTHFANTVVAELRDQNHASHIFVLAYCPSSNGTAKVVSREILRVLRALTFELHLRFHE